MANNDIQLDLNQDQADQVVQQNVPARAQTTLAFRVEQSKIPDFWGQKVKDTVTAIIFVRKIDNLARSNNWNDIIDGLSNLAMGPNETTGELLARITNTMVIIKESYLAYENKIPEPPTDAQGLRQVGLLEATVTQWKNNTVNNMLQFLKMQLFRASLPGDLRKAIAQHDQNTITLDDMYQVATDTQRESGPKALQPVSAINDDSQSETEEDEEADDEVAAFQNKRNNWFQNRNRSQNQG
jgi:hypothetical protein